MEEINMNLINEFVEYAKDRIAEDNCSEHFISTKKKFKSKGLLVEVNVY
ncbi:hypothetical protein [Methanobacterium spitsbergense]|uniref:Uncharacterized protein n=1 Tax=Methanobacterium spitsbergense TaxID=2874285 RepID=A0A8T5UYW8_9EURY|nr:hypothetical protein [Methanobacterium spitsbergense]MBZ2166360.1 hypothetical protein [Methanobacterium spitsbergense]